MAKAVKAKELAVIAANRMGLLLDISNALAAAKINVSSVCAYVLDDKAYFLLIVDKHAAAKRILSKAGYTLAEDSVILLELANKPGELARAAGRVSGSGVDINYLYGTASARKSTVVIKTKDDARTLKVLRK